MILLKRIGKNIGQVLMILGIVLIVYSIFNMYKWRYSQKNMLKENTENIKVITSVENIAENREEKVQFSKKFEEKDESEIEIDNQIHDNHIKREDYENGMMIIDMPKLKVRAGVMKGTAIEELKEGPGLYEISPLVFEQGGNVCIAGHRTTYGAWFRNVDKLISGDHILIEFNGLKYIYKVERVFIVEKNDWSVTKSTGYSALTLTACHPLKSAKQRIVVRAKLEKTEKLPQN